VERRAKFELCSTWNAKRGNMDKNEAIKRILSRIEYELILAVENTESRKCWFWLTEKDLKKYKEFELVHYIDFESGTKGIFSESRTKEIVSYPSLRYHDFLRVKIEGGFAFVKIPLL
jgi:hypothetical protein